MNKLRSTAVRAALVAAPVLFALIATAGKNWAYPPGMGTRCPTSRVAYPSGDSGKTLGPGLEPLLHKTTTPARGRATPSPPPRDWATRRVFREIDRGLKNSRIGIVQPTPTTAGSTCCLATT